LRSISLRRERVLCAKRVLAGEVFRLPITDDSVRDAVARSIVHFVESDMIPEKMQTALHVIIKDLVKQGIIQIQG